MICLRRLLLHHQHVSMLLLRRVKLWKQRRRSVTDSLDSSTPGTIVLGQGPPAQTPSIMHIFPLS